MISKLYNFIIMINHNHTTIYASKSIIFALKLQVQSQDLLYIQAGQVTTALFF